MKTNYLNINSCLIILIIILTGCTKPFAPEKPEIKIKKDKDTVFFNSEKTFDTVHYVLKITPDFSNGVTLKNLTISYDSFEFENINLENSGASITMNYDYLIPEYFKKDTVINLFFKVYDSNQKMVTREDSIIVRDRFHPEIIFYPTYQVNYNSTSSTTEFGWHLSEEIGLIITQVNYENADLVFIFNDTYRQQILSPDAEQIEIQDFYSTWNYDIAGKKNTKIQKSTYYEWYNATYESINKLVIESEIHPNGGNGVCFVCPDDIYAFELSDGRKGLCKVIDSNPPYAKFPFIESSLTLDFKVQIESKTKISN